MKAKELQDLIDFISKSGLNKVDIETEEFKLSIEREASQKVKYYGGGAPMHAAPAPMQMPAAAPAQPSAPAAPAAEAPKAAAPAASDESKYVPVKAPMIGTFYRASSPETPAFVNVGDEIKKGQVVCIIEAMKLFNEIESEVSGRIVKVLVDNATPVEYDQPLFLVEPN
ncbi:MAG: acetyl-CoA carboxylase biotin carboxyl carrier protein [Hymenobacteraceae bacterium]|nr:acetyl-CoA carboxylase biotin carboxyl carrier protein [Hymenobacteraceae bacterium]MDX5397756.1 acetyl-CoA carboxylase biotin carboxyl carrier protein [Hymenobacteraceae bacterium]MDX5442351.1 acetyl-CoA carboxylase biotin carboxyl carrier protein [Hymenobacteraceae bacterium]MDX5513833.1 acetyl-CoA carboxylase biotin carboxyl carrier protein [Hymenobacteraceae bacterium]